MGFVVLFLHAFFILVTFSLTFYLTSLNRNLINFINLFKEPTFGSVTFIYYLFSFFIALCFHLYNSLYFGFNFLLRIFFFFAAAQIIDCKPFFLIKILKLYISLYILLKLHPTDFILFSSPFESECFLIYFVSSLISGLFRGILFGF